VRTESGLVTGYDTPSGRNHQGPREARSTFYLRHGQPLASQLLQPKSSLRIRSFDRLPSYVSSPVTESFAAFVASGIESRQDGGMLILLLPKRKHRRSTRRIMLPEQNGMMCKTWGASAEAAPYPRAPPHLAERVRSLSSFKLFLLVSKSHDYSNLSPLFFMKLLSFS
jgi:hypothetical protein